MTTASARRRRPIAVPDQDSSIEGLPIGTLTSMPEWAIRSPRERVVNDIIQGLYDGRYKPGQRLVEAKLTETYGISRGPVREALNRLAALGLVDLALQRGGEIRTLTLDDAIDILTVVQGLMRMAGRLAAKRIHAPGAVARLDAALAELKAFEGLSTSLDYALARDRFFSVVTSLSGNAELQRIMPSVQIHLVRVQFRQRPETLDHRRHAGYQRIVEAILSGSGQAAEEAMRVQFARTIKYMEALRDGQAQGVSHRTAG